MKVYVVCADNGMSYEDYSHWIDSIHASLESATNYIQARKEEAERSTNRYNELRDLSFERDLTEAEDREAEYLSSHEPYAVDYYIEEYELNGV